MWIGTDERRWSHFRVDVDTLKTCMGVYEFAVYCALIAHAETETGLAHPSEATIASYFCISDRRVRGAIQWLEANRWIRVKRRLGKASAYYVLPPPTPEQISDVATPDPGTDFLTLRNHVPETPEQISDELVPSDNDQGTRNISFDDPQRLCDLLADLIEANGSKRPTVTKRWLDECERMIRLDGRTPEQVERCIRWSQQHVFWKTVILSMPKVRHHFDRMRLVAESEKANGNGRATPRDWDVIAANAERDRLAGRS